MKEEFKNFCRKISYPLVLIMVFIAGFWFHQAISTSVPLLEVRWDPDKVEEVVEEKNVINEEVAETVEDDVEEIDAEEEPDLDFIVSNWVRDNMLSYDHDLQLVQHGQQSDYISSSGVEFYTYEISLYKYNEEKAKKELDSEYIILINKSCPGIGIIPYKKYPSFLF